MSTVRLSECPAAVAGVGTSAGAAPAVVGWCDDRAVTEPRSASCSATSTGRSSRRRRVHRRHGRAVARLRAAGIAFAVTSGRPPRGMAMLVSPRLSTTRSRRSTAACSSTIGWRVLGERTIPDEVVSPVLDLIAESGLDTWIYRGSDWLVRDANAPHVDRESATVQFRPTVVADFDDVLAAAAARRGPDREDHRRQRRPRLVARIAEQAPRISSAEHASAARSQPYYLDVTHPKANKGAVVDHLCAKLGDPPRRCARSATCRTTC